MATGDSMRVMCKMLYVLKKLSDDWLFSKLCHGDCESFNNAHLPLLFSIGDEGISNSKLAAKLNVSKQAASKVIKELEEQKLVHTEKSADDARSSTIHLTAGGKQLRGHIKAQMMEMEEQYIKVLGTKNYNIAMDALQKMIDFHEEQLKVKLN
ncbi:MarR family winged helix-turn-helix transcriptional regulator [Mucilaginibacter sp. AW1-3]